MKDENPSDGILNCNCEDATDRHVRVSEPEKTPEDYSGNIFDIPGTAHGAYLAARNTAYNGRSHEILTSGLAPENWSTKTVSEQEIGALLLRSLNAPRNGARRR